MVTGSKLSITSDDSLFASRRYIGSQQTTFSDSHIIVIDHGWSVNHSLLLFLKYSMLLLLIGFHLIVFHYDLSSNIFSSSSKIFSVCPVWKLATITFHNFLCMLFNYLYIYKSLLHQERQSM